MAEKVTGEQPGEPYGLTVKITSHWPPDELEVAAAEHLRQGLSRIIDAELERLIKETTCPEK